MHILIYDDKGHCLFIVRVSMPKNYIVTALMRICRFPHRSPVLPSVCFTAIDGAMAQPDLIRLAIILAPDHDISPPAG